MSVVHRALLARLSGCESLKTETRGSRRYRSSTPGYPLQSLPG